MTDELKEKMLRKLAKLKALAEHGGTPEESASAAAKMQELLLQYNLDLSEVELESGKHPDDYKEDSFTLGNGSGTDWRRLLIQGIARTNFCRLAYSGYSNRQTGPKVWLVGRPHNIEVVKEIYSWLSEELDYTARLRCAVRGVNRWGEREPAGTWKDSFLRGAVSVISNRLWEARQQTVDESARATALVRMTDLELEDASKKIWGKLVAGNSTAANNYSHSGLEAGKEYGASVNLNRSQQMANPSGRKSLTGR